MKEPIEYLGNVNCFTTREELYNIGKQMQIDAYNEAINDAINELPDRILVYSDSYDYSCGVEGKDNYYIDYIRDLLKV